MRRYGSRHAPRASIPDGRRHWPARPGAARAQAATHPASLRPMIAVASERPPTIPIAPVRLKGFRDELPQLSRTVPIQRACRGPSNGCRIASSPRQLGVHVGSAVTIFERPDSCLSSVRPPYLPQDRLHMDLDRCFGHVAFTGDHLLESPFAKSLRICSSRSVRP